MAAGRNHAAQGAPWAQPQFGFGYRGHARFLLQHDTIKERLPELIITPAHDMRVFAESNGDRAVSLHDEVRRSKLRMEKTASAPRILEGAVKEPPGLTPGGTTDSAEFRTPGSES